MHGDVAASAPRAGVGPVGGTTAAFGMRLSARGRRLLQRSQELRAQATIQARDEAGNARTDKVNLIFRAPARKRNP